MRALVDLAPRLGGAERDRTDDLLLAKQALSQLSYSPRDRRSESADQIPDFMVPGFRTLVGQGRLELPTSRLSSARSNQLSYWPGSENQAWDPEFRRLSWSSWKG